MENLSRRDFLWKTAKIAVGVAALSATPVLASAQNDEPAAEHPFPYHKLDPQATMERGYQSFMSLGGCACGAFDAIIGQLADEYGYPYNQVPVKMYSNGGGGYGAAALCGSLGGCAGAIGLLVPPEDAPKVTADLFAWYRGAELPSYQPEMELVKTVAESVLCADSVGKHMTAQGYTSMGDPQRKARCAGVTAEAAAKTVELLNAYYGL